MPASTIMIEIARELKNAKKLHPNWPDHAAAQAGVVCEEAGELMQACMQWKYERNENDALQKIQKEKMRIEAIHVAASAIRFLENLK